MKTIDEYTKEEVEKVEGLANELSDATVRYLTGNLSDELEAQNITNLRQELEEMGFEIQCNYSFDFGINKYACVVTLWVPKYIH